jgi:LmbE family N-acetylglucosaminyl deacetylase
MLMTAHPDDENNVLLAMMDRGEGIRTVVASATRGSGGQNEIGPELFEALAVLRTEELQAVHRYDGAEQLFTRAVDFGFSFSVEESFEKWGRDEILGDFVRHIRTVRPDVITAMRPDGGGGGQHHQASAILAKEAFRAAGDATRFPEQLKEGLRPWQAAKFYFTASFGSRGEPAPSDVAQLLTIDGSGYDPLLGRTYVEIGSLARSMHKCQGMAQLLALPGSNSPIRYRLADTTIAGQMEREERTLFDGVDTSWPSLSRFAQGESAAQLNTRLTDVARHVDAARASFDASALAEVTSRLAAALRAVRRLRQDLMQLELTEDARREISGRLAFKESQFQDALALSAGIRVDALSDDGLVTPGQGIKATTLVANRGSQEVHLQRVVLGGMARSGASCPSDATLLAGQVFSCVLDVDIESNLSVTEPYFKRLPDVARDEFEKDAPFGAPFRPTPFVAAIDLVIAGERVTLTRPVEYRYEGNIFSGEKRMELKVVPAFSVAVTPEILIVPTAGPSASVSRTGSRMKAIGHELRVTVVNGVRGASTGDVSLQLPAGWKASPATATVQFAREDEARTVRFSVTPPAQLPTGEYRVGAVVSHAGETYDRGYQVVEYPHTHRRHLYWPAAARVKAVDVKVPPGLRVGYVMGVGDEVPPALEQLGVRLEMLGPDDLAWGNLDGYDAIVTGVRAYERRDDLRANNERLLQYVERGGTMLVQYNKFEFNEAQYGPFPAKVSSNRVTDEQAPVEHHIPGHPVFTFPNRIGPAAWQGWVQERGLYFLGERDARYVDLLRLADTFPYNEGPKSGALVEARYGKGRWIYLGIGLWRQLPAGTDGAYRLLANLISLGKASAAGPADAGR